MGNYIFICGTKNQHASNKDLQKEVWKEVQQTKDLQKEVIRNQEKILQKT